MFSTNDVRLKKIDVEISVKIPQPQSKVDNHSILKVSMSFSKVQGGHTQHFLLKMGYVSATKAGVSCYTCVKS